jgi:hypothetical protein
MSNQILNKNYIASLAIAAYRIVARTATEDVGKQATGATDKLYGVSTDIAAADGERFDVVEIGLADVQAGAAFAEGDELTSDANGKAIAVIPPRIHVSGVAGAAAGAHAVPGILATDTLLSVLAVDVRDASAAITDVTAQYTVTGAGTIDNTGGTTSANLLLLVTWRNQDVRVVGVAECAAGGADEIVAMRVSPRVLRA